MKCLEVKKCLTDLAEQQKLNNLETRYREHIRSCASCRGEYQSLLEYQQLMNDFPQVAPTADFSDAWKRRLRLEAMHKTPPKPWFSFIKLNRSLIPALGSLAAIAIVLLIIQVFPIGPNLTNSAKPEQSLDTAITMKAVPETEQFDNKPLMKSEIANATYQLKIITAGPQVKQVQKVIRNFRSTHEGGLTFSYRESEPDMTLLKDLTKAEADALQKELEQYGAKVEVAVSE